MTGFVVRPAVVADAPAIARVHWDSHHEAYVEPGRVPREAVEGWSMRDRILMWTANTAISAGEFAPPEGFRAVRVWVAEAGGEIVGFASTSEPRGADVSGADVSGAGLSSADVSRAGLSGANVSGSDVSGLDASELDASAAGLVDAAVDPTADPVADPDRPRPLSLDAIYVLESSHGSGAGQALIDAAIGERPAFLWVLADNPRAHAFYRRNGFAPDGTEKPDEFWHVLAARWVR